MGEIVKLIPRDQDARQLLRDASEDETILECILITKWKDDDGSIQTSVWYSSGDDRLANMGRCFAAGMKLWNNAPRETEE